MKFVQTALIFLSLFLGTSTVFGAASEHYEINGSVVYPIPTTFMSSANWSITPSEGVPLVIASGTVTPPTSTPSTTNGRGRVRTGSRVVPGTPPEIGQPTREDEVGQTIQVPGGLVRNEPLPRTDLERTPPPEGRVEGISTSTREGVYRDTGNVGTTVSDMEDVRESMKPLFAERSSRVGVLIIFCALYGVLRRTRWGRETLPF